MPAAQKKRSKSKELALPRKPVALTGGRPQWAPTDTDRRVTRALTIAGYTQDSIGQLLGVSPDTLRKHLREDLDHAKMDATAKVVENLLWMATQKDFRALGAAVFYLKTQAGWKERDPEEVGGPAPTMVEEPPHAHN